MSRLRDDAPPTLALVALAGVARPISARCQMTPCSSGLRRPWGILVRPRESSGAVARALPSRVWMGYAVGASDVDSSPVVAPCLPLLDAKIDGNDGLVESSVWRPIPSQSSNSNSCSRKGIPDPAPVELSPSLTPSCSSPDTPSLVRDESVVAVPSDQSSARDHPTVPRGSSSSPRRDPAPSSYGLAANEGTESSHPLLTTPPTRIDGALSLRGLLPDPPKSEHIPGADSVSGGIEGAMAVAPRTPTEKSQRHSPCVSRSVSPPRERPPPHQRGQDPIRTRRRTSAQGTATIAPNPEPPHREAKQRR